MAEKLIEIVRKRIHGEPPESEIYVRAMAEIIERVYKRRYPHVRIPRFKDYDKAGPSSRGKIDSIFSTYSDGTLIVEFQTFFNRSFEELEDHDLILKIYYKVLHQSDKEFKRLLYHSLKSLLQKMIDDLAPGLETRKKQIHKILYECCLDVHVKGRRFWKLKKCKVKELKPANLDQLQDAARSLTAPKLMFPKKRDAKRGPSINRNDMEQYLKMLIERAGGMVERNDMIKFFRKLYGLGSIQQMNIFVNREHENSVNTRTIDDHLSAMAYGSGNFHTGHDHFVMAKEILSKMDNQMKEVYYQRLIKEKSTEDTSRKLKCSTGKVSSLEKRIRTLFTTYFSTGGLTSTPEEVEGVTELVSTAILRDWGKQ